MPDRLAYPIPEAAQVLGIGRTKLYELVTTGAIETVTIGWRRLIRHEALVAYLDGITQRAA